MCTLQISFKPLLLKGEEKYIKSVSRGSCEKLGGKLVTLLSQLRPRIRHLDILHKFSHATVTILFLSFLAYYIQRARKGKPTFQANLSLQLFCQVAVTLILDIGQFSHSSLPFFTLICVTRNIMP
jgi:hypothetical protein